MPKVKEQKLKVCIALSGGVDSSVAAALLVESGHEVVAAFMKNWSDTKTLKGECAWKEEYRDACRVAAMLDTPIVLFDFEKEYRKQVVEYLFREYGAGRTPNPDVFCNSEVKFPLFWREAQKLGADMIATGHYVRREQRTDPSTRLRAENREQSWVLLAGKDPNKDQSYFLHQLSQNDLAHTLFPIGEYMKAEVRNMARARGLPTADKRSTRGMCFVGKVPMPQFLAQAIPATAGPVRTTHGDVVGEHHGVAPFTIGQRHGFGVGGGTPYYVVLKDPVTNTLVVGDENDPALYRKELTLADVHWISGTAPSLPLDCQVRIRYRSPLTPATLSISRSLDLSISFNNPVRAPAPGQFAVCYDGDVCLGGGVIV